MDSKLTLKLDNGVIEQAKIYAKENNISLSKMIENYLQAITIEKEGRIRISPLVESLTGVIKSSKTSEDDYVEYISDKYK